jgi:hypothetical protein
MQYKLFLLLNLMKLEFFLFVLVTFAGAHLPYTEDNGKLHYYYASVVNC